MNFKTNLNALLSLFYRKTSVDDKKAITGLVALNFAGAVVYSQGGTYTAPFDGFMLMSGIANKTKIGDIGVDCYSSNGSYRMLTLQAAALSNWLQSTVPVKKGAVYVCFSTGNAITVNRVVFFPLLGGG